MSSPRLVSQSFHSDTAASATVVAGYRVPSMSITKWAGPKVAGNVKGNVDFRFVANDFRGWVVTTPQFKVFRRVRDVSAGLDCP